MPMSEINVTPMVDVMLVLLIIFMVAAPLLQVGVPDRSAGGQGQADSEPNRSRSPSPSRPTATSSSAKRRSLDELATKLKAIAKNGYDETIFVRGDKGVPYGIVMKVMGRINDGGFKKLSFVLDQEKGGT